MKCTQMLCRPFWGLLAGLLPLCFTVPAAIGAPITYVFSGPASGTLGATPFTGAQTTVTGTADTVNITVNGGGDPCINLTGVTINIAGLGSATPTGPTLMFDNRVNQIWGFENGICGAGLSDWLDVDDPQAATYGLVTSIGPTTGALDVRSSVATTAGALTFTSPPLTFQASLTSREMFVSNFANNSVTVYARAADGNKAPVGTLSGGLTGLYGPAGLALDEVNAEMFVANSNNNSITVYDLAADGNIAPVRTIVGAATGLNGPWGIFLDPVNNELFVANNFSPGTITVYAARTADGNASPLRTLRGALTALDFPINVAVDTVHNELVVANATGNPGQSITVYPRTATGNVGPLRNIHGPATGLDNPVGVAVDTVNNELVESNFTPSVSTFSRTADLNAKPIRSIAGAATGLTQTAGGVALDTKNGEVFVANYFGDSITVYARIANGPALPLRRLAGNLTGLAQPSFVAITMSNLPPTAVALARPLTNAVIAQNKVGGALCPSDPTRGSGYRILFQWAYAKPPTFNHFHLHVQRVGAPLAALDTDLTGKNFNLLACNSVVVDSDLANWIWQVTAIDNSGAVLGVSKQRPFSFAPCRLSNGAACTP